MFTSGGTEADNLALKGLWWARLAEDPRRRRILLSGDRAPRRTGSGHLAGAAREARRSSGCRSTSSAGSSRTTYERAIESDPESVSFVTLMMANNEVGTLQPVHEVAALAQEYGIPVHTDAVQAVGQVPVDFAELGVDAMTISAHKVGGPFGIGALVVRKETKLVPILHGGGQERDVRSGTLDAPATAGFAVAMEHAVKHQAERGAPPDRAAGRADRRRPEHGGWRRSCPGDPAGRLPGNAHLSFSGCEGDSLLLLLDARGIEVSTGSACNAGVAEPSHVLLAMGYDDQRARGSLRFTLGHTSTRADIDAVLENIGPVVERAMSAGLQNVGRNN